TAGKSAPFYKQGCSVSQYGGAVTYNVPAHKYSSLISQAEVDEMEQDEIDANGQANANVKGNCIATTDPYYRGESSASTRCQTDAYGSHTGRMEILMKDINPNSTTYNATAWKDVGFNEETCPHDEGTFPSYPTGASSGHGVRIFEPGALVTVTVTFNSNDSKSSMLGHISGTGGGAVNLVGSGTLTQTFSVTVPPEGYISWSLTVNDFYPNAILSSNIQFLQQ
ncbi:MAG: DUF5977 domain-containing protein, partial [Parafilimonas sp.]